MTRTSITIAAITILGAAACGIQGCRSAADDCERLGTCGPGAGGASTGPGAGGGTGCIAGAPPADGGCVDAGAGIFVRRDGDDEAPGTPEEPVATLAQAITLATMLQVDVFACAETFDEHLTLASGTRLFGGLDCDGGWAWTGARTVVAPQDDDGSPVVRLLSGEGSTVVHDVDVLAPSATIPSSSSIAVLAEATGVTWARGLLRAGAGADGLAGQDAPSEPAAGGVNGKDGSIFMSCSISPKGGAASVTGSCPTTVGGKGGDSGTSATDGQPGEDGQPLDPGGGQGGLGDTWYSLFPCGTGGDGLNGEAGGFGAGGTGLGTLGADGYVGAAGEAGGQGAVGQGGGGGGSRAATQSCTPNPDIKTHGPGGGGGASGGCGGLPGAGGQAGGASIALVSVNAALTLEDVTLESADGGDGGAGGAGQPGGPGGVGGDGACDGSLCSCDGGDGGKGGDGGPGGGGSGGHSLGIGFVGVPPTLTGSSAATLGQPGAGGLGGGGITANQGAMGLSQAQLDFSRPGAFR